MNIVKGQLISSQRYLDRSKVTDRVLRFKRFIVAVYPIVLRGVQYTILISAPITKKVMKVIGGMTDLEREAFFINNITDSHYYYVETGEVVHELLLPDTSCKFQGHAGNQWIFGGAS